MDETFSLDILFTQDGVFEELYELVQQGLCSQLTTRLNVLPDSTAYLTTLTWQRQGQLSLLMVAALNGYDDIIRILLTHSDPIQQIELKGQLNISDDVSIHGATALYCACYQEHFTAAKTLIELGKADVNQDTYDYPDCSLLYHATVMNRINIVRFLIENNYLNENSETKSRRYCTRSAALIVAALRNYSTLIKYLIENGADINHPCPEKHLKGQTPIECATHNDHIDVVRLLYDAGANIDGEILIKTAVKCQSYAIIDFLIEKSITTVEDLELIACSFIVVSTPIEKMEHLLKILELVLKRRLLMNIPKVCIQPIAAYNYQQECQTIEELNGIKNDCERIYIETLLIRDRIFLIRKDITIMKPLHYYGDMLVNRDEFDKVLDIWIHMFHLYQQAEISTTLHRFIWLFCRMLKANRLISVDRFLQICLLAFQPSHLREGNIATYNALYLVIIATKILEQDGITKEEEIGIYRWIKDLCRLQLTNKDEKTLVHLCIEIPTYRYTSWFRCGDLIPYLTFPNESALRLLLACGSRWLDLDAVESSNGNTPLHLICQGAKDRQIIKLLMNSGSHMDCVNKEGKTPIDYIGDKEIRTLLMPKSTPLNLKCLCARIIVNQQLNTDSLKPSRSALNKFIILHGGRVPIESVS